MTTLREAAAQAMHTLEVIAQTVGLMNYWADAPREVRLDKLTDEAIEALQQAFAQPESEPAITQNLDPLAVFAIEVEMGAWHPDEMAERAAIALKQSKWQVPAPVEAQPESEPSDREASELQRHNDYVAGFSEATKRAQQAAVPQGLVEILIEASAFIHAVHNGDTPETRYPIVDELDGFAHMLKAAPQPQQVAVPQSVMRGDLSHGYKLADALDDYAKHMRGVGYDSQRETMQACARIIRSLMPFYAQQVAVLQEPVAWVCDVLQSDAVFRPELSFIEPPHNLYSVRNVRPLKYSGDEIYRQVDDRVQQVAVPPTQQQLAQGAFIPQVTGFGAAPQWAVAIITECPVNGQQTVTEIDGRWKFLREGDLLCAVPQPPAYAPLSDAEIIDIRKQCYGGRFGVPAAKPWSDSVRFGRAIEQAMRGKA